MHPKMDRGLLKIHGLPLPLFKQNLLNNVIPFSPIAQSNASSNLILEYSHRLLMLTFNWYSGKSAADVFIPCLILHRPNILMNDLMRWITWTVLRCSLMLADIIAQSNVSSIDEFLPNLYSLIDNRIDISDEGLISWFESNRLQIEEEYGSFVLQECLFHLRWLLFLRNIKSRSTPNSDYYGVLIQILTELKDQYHCHCTSFGYLDDQSSFYFPIISNLFTSGCVRRTIQLVSFEDGLADFYNFVGKLLETMLYIQKRPSFKDLFFYLLRDHSNVSVYSALHRSFIKVSISSLAI